MDHRPGRRRERRHPALTPGVPDQERLRQARHETPEQQADRNWADLLGELRVTQTGVQILFSLLLTVPFTERFADLTDGQRAIYLAGLLLAASAVLVLVAPVTYHRLLFGRGDKAHVVDHSHVLAVVGAGLGALAVCAVLLLVVDVVLGRGQALAVTALYLAASAWLLFGAGLRRRRVTRRRQVTRGR